jgi:hypothetical protein
MRPISLLLLTRAKSSASGSKRNSGRALLAGGDIKEAMEDGHFGRGTEFYDDRRCRLPTNHVLNLANSD